MAGMFGTDGVRARVNTGAMTAEAVKEVLRRTLYALGVRRVQSDQADPRLATACARTRYTRAAPTVSARPATRLPVGTNAA